MRSARFLRGTKLWLAVAVWAASGSFALADDGGCIWPPKASSDVPAVVAACGALLQAGGSDTERASILVRRGRAYKFMRQLDKAAFDLEEAMKLTPNDPVVYVWRGWIAYDQGIYPYAAALAERGLSMDGTLVFAYDLLGSVAVETGNLGAARDAYNKAVDIDPANLHARENRYRLYRRVGAQHEQLRELDEMLALQSPELDVIGEVIKHRPVSIRVKRRIERAQLLLSMGRKEDAAKAYDEFVRDDPGAVSYGVRANFRYAVQENNTLALADIDEGLKADDTFAYLHSQKGFIMSSLKRYPEAAESFTRALTLQAADGPALWGRANARREMDQIKPAIADAQMALIVDSDFLQFKAPKLVSLGYLPETAEDSDALNAVKDAAQACMIDTRCW